MTTEQPKRFDPETDPDRPKIGEVVEIEEGVSYSVAKVRYMTAGEMLRDPKGPSPDEFDEVRVRPHPRFAIYWVVWFNKVTQ